jgi:hypothetical protein
MDRSELKSVHWTDLTGFAGRSSPLFLCPRCSNICRGKQEAGLLKPR